MEIQNLLFKIWRNLKRKERGWKSKKIMQREKEINQIHLRILAQTTRSKSHPKTSQNSTDFPSQFEQSKTIVSVSLLEASNSPPYTKFDETKHSKASALTQHSISNTTSTSEAPKPTRRKNSTNKTMQFSDLISLNQSVTTRSKVLGASNPTLPDASL